MYINSPPINHKSNFYVLANIFTLSLFVCASVIIYHHMTQPNSQEQKNEYRKVYDEEE